jgi:D-serine deaminase-like pyridoxal phosphate-dependent protein
MDLRNLIGKPVSEADTPALLLDMDALQANIDRMAAFYKGRPCGLRPHFKSHKCTSIARMQMEAGAVGITCAKLGEAEVVADAGITDILIANQIVGADKISRLVELAKRADPIVAVDSIENVRELSEAAASEDNVTIRVLVEVDIGMNRCGVAPGKPALELAKFVSAAFGLNFEGLQGYEGHLVLLRDQDERATKTREALRTLVDTRRLIEDSGIQVNIVSGGGTGTYEITSDYPGIDEVQAGTYATMDWWYGEIRPEFRQAISILTAICSRPRSGVAIVDVGTKGVGADFGPPILKDVPGGEVARFGSEEHTILAIPDSGPRLGAKIEMIPSHGCVTCNLYREFIVHSNGVVVDIWPIEGSGKLQ